MEIILASGSAQRAEFFRKIFGNEFTIEKSEFEEDNNLDLPPKDLAIHHALGKARAVARKHGSGVIVAADTFVYLDSKVLGKPRDAKEAIRLISMQSGRIIEIYSGLAVIDAAKDKEYHEYSVTKAKFTRLTEDEIKAYVNTGEWQGKAGGWAVLGKASMFIEHIDGCVSNIAGLPLNQMFKIFRKIGVDVFRYRGQESG